MQIALIAAAALIAGLSALDIGSSARRPGTTASLPSPISGNSPRQRTPTAESTAPMPTRIPSHALTSGPTGTPTSAPVPPARSGAAQAEQEVLLLVNQARVQNGCQPLRWDDRLGRAARLHSVDMAAHAYYSHDSQNGQGPKERMIAQGYDAASAENIDVWERTAQGAFAAWMKSPGHRANILNCASHATGIGYAASGPPYYAYWTQDFGYE